MTLAATSAAMHPSREPTTVVELDPTVHSRPCLLAGTRLDLIQSFVVLSEELHVGNAAARLYVTQSGLSRRLAVLECQLGVVLFDRSTRRLVLSNAGLVLLPFAQVMLAQAVEASRQLRLVRQRGADVLA